MGSHPFNQLNRNGNGGMLQQFRKFMEANKGRDPDAMIREIVSSGQLTQDQLNIVQQRAGQISGAFDGLKGMFGF